MSNGMKNGVTLSLFWSVICCVIVLGGWVMENQDKVHTRELSEVRKAHEAMRVEMRDDIQIIRADMRKILNRLPVSNSE